MSYSDTNPLNTERLNGTHVEYSNGITLSPSESVVLNLGLNFALTTIGVDQYNLARNIRRTAHEVFSSIQDSELKVRYINEFGHYLFQGLSR
ncbi:hypothetical protein GJ496_009312 [Pomphorhynchus laevis]|nr:hypothetical protein GJ496_009312 [Pomphorhynchus laevis]